MNATRTAAPDTLRAYRYHRPSAALRMGAIWRVWVLMLASGSATLMDGAAPPSSAGTYPITQYSKREYKAHDQIWCAGQDARGVLYFGNSALVLSFDGEQWRRFAVPGAGMIRSLDVEPGGRVWVGGSSDLGYLEPGGPQGLKWVSLRDKLPPLDHEVGDIASVFATDQGVFFGGYFDVVRWKDNAMQVWTRSIEQPLRLRRLGGAMWLFERGVGLSRLDGDTWTVVSTDPLFVEADIQGALDDVDGSWLVTTRDPGLFRIRNLVPERVPLGIDALLEGANVRGLARFPDGALALPTVDRGTFLLASDGALEAVFDRRCGLASEFHRSPFVDRDGGLWLLTNNGLAHVGRGPYTIFDQHRGLPAAFIHHIVRHEDRILLATDSGLFEVETRAVEEGGARVRALTTTPADVAGCCSHASGVLFSTPETVLTLGPGDRIEPAFDAGIPVGGLYPSPQDNSVLFVGTIDGVGVARWRDGAWSFIGKLPGTQGDVRTMVQSADGTLWSEARGHGLARTRFASGSDTDPARATTELFTAQQGLPAETTWSSPRLSRRGEVLASTGYGLFVFSEKAQRFERYLGYGAHLGGSVFVDRIAEDSSGTAWASTAHAADDEDDAPLGRGVFGRSLLKANGTRRWEPLPSRLFAPAGELSDLCIDEESGHRLLWAASEEHLVRIDLDRLGAQATMPGWR